MNSPNSSVLWRHFGSREQVILTEERSRRFLGEGLRGSQERFSLKEENRSRYRVPAAQKGLSSNSFPDKCTCKSANAPHVGPRVLENFQRGKKAIHAASPPPSSRSPGSQGRTLPGRTRAGPRPRAQAKRVRTGPRGRPAQAP